MVTDESQMENTSQPCRTILLAVDNSKQSFDVLSFYVERLRMPGDKLVILHVYQPPSLTGISLNAVPGTYLANNYSSQIDLEVEDAKQLLRGYKNHCEQRKIDCTVMLQSSFGHPGQTICRVAQDIKASLTIVGSRGAGPVSRFILGSVSDYVVHYLESNVCVVPTNNKN